MDQQEFSPRTEAAKQLGADEATLKPIIERAYTEDREREPDWDAIDAKRRRNAAASEAAYNCPRGEYR